MFDEMYTTTPTLSMLFVFGLPNTIQHYGKNNLNYIALLVRATKGELRLKLEISLKSKLTHKSKGSTFFPSSSSSTDSVEVVFISFWELIVNYMANVFHVYSSCDNIRGN